MTEIKTVVYDFGNVLVHWDPKAALAEFEPNEVDDFFAEFDFHAWNYLMDAGRYTFAEAREIVEQEMPQWLPFVDDYFRNYPLTLAEGPIEGSTELVEELKTRGVRLLGLSNWWVETFPYADAATPAIAMMDDYVISGRVGMAKPDLEIFQYLIERFDLDPWSCLFVDDSQANVTTAHTLGFVTHLFTDTPSLRAELVRLGIL